MARIYPPQAPRKAKGWLHLQGAAVRPSAANFSGAIQLLVYRARKSAARCFRFHVLGIAHNKARPAAINACILRYSCTSLIPKA